jgi:hypothetical protein
MKDYFVLQFVLLNRKFKENGIHPLLAYLTGLAAFVLIPAYLFQKTEFAKYLLLLICLGFLFRLSGQNRSDFLRVTFGDRKSRMIRVAENLAVAIPFMAFLIFKQDIFEAFLLLIAGCVMASYSFHGPASFTLPTPFSGHPFEFAVGFRSSFFLILVAYALTIISIFVNNLNLGIFSMLLIYLITLSYYLNPENEFYVWIHSDSPGRFLFRKMKRAAINSFVLIVPVLLCLLVSHPKESGTILLLYFLGLCYLWTIILAKYSAYPNGMNLPEGVLFVFSVSFPPVLLVILPFFYNRSVNKLKIILNDRNS